MKQAITCYSWDYTGEEPPQVDERSESDYSIDDLSEDDTEDA